MTKTMTGVAWVLVTLLAASAAGGQWDKKTIEKMLKDGAKKMSSPKTEEREDGAGYLLGYITCDYRAQYQPVLVQALKDSSPKVRERAVQTLERIQAVDTVPLLLAMLEDPNSDVQVRAAYAIGGMGTAAKAAEPELKKAHARAMAQKDSVLEGSLINAIAEVTGKQPPNRYKCP
jgi:HEAT repeat protein